MECLLLLTQLLCLLSFHLHLQASCHLNSSSSSKVLCPYDQSHALLQFKRSFSINNSASLNFTEYYDDMYDPFGYYIYKYAPPPYPKTESWKDGTDCCSWDGVNCDLKSGNVIGLDLSSSMLYGTFNNSLFLLSHLQKLDLSNNHFNYSNISSHFGQLLNLTHLNLNNSLFEGQLPSEFSLLSKLVSLDLSLNYLEVDTTSFVKIFQNLTNLKELNLNDVNMSMVAPSSFFNFPSSVSHLNLRSCWLSTKFVKYINFSTELVSLDLSENDDLGLDTTAFVKLVQNLTKLREFDLSFANLSSVSPASLMNLSSSLTYLKLLNCTFQGKFPDNVHLSKLIYLDLSENDNLTFDTIAFNELVTNLPNLREIQLTSVNMSLIATTSFTNLSSSVSSLDLSYCGLQGDFPGNLIQRPNLRVLNLWGNNDLTGFLPPLSNWSSSLQTLDVSWTKVAIHLEPYFFSNLKSLKQLSLRSCKFIGSYLILFSNLTQLTKLDLSYNNFNGEIPSSFGNLQQLSWLDLSSNNFSGYIPSSFANLKQLTYLFLGNNSLSGPLPAYFSNFTDLSDLDLQNNRFIGSIPSQIGKLSNLYMLDLSNNFFNASIPSCLFSLPQLEYLHLQNNQLHGLIGQFPSKSLYYIDLSNNKLQGSIPSSIFNLKNLNVLILSSNKLIGEFSSSVCKLGSLEILDLSNNSFTGFIPQCLGNFSNSLFVLHLGINNFYGTIPATFSQDNGLRYLNFNGNRLNGGIPPSIANCTYLEILDLGKNEINDTFPFFLASLPNLQIIVLRSNKLHGSLQCPIANCSFPELRIFDISTNKLSGPLPAEFFNDLPAMMMCFNSDVKYMVNVGNTYDYSVSLTFKGLEIQLHKIQTALALIDLSLNKFTGKIPDSIKKLKSLNYLNISHNYLARTIPPLLANLSNLESLDLSSNSLTGRIPMQLVDLPFLEVFRVGNNQLEGPIPNGNQFDTFDNSSYAGNTRLCGPPLSKACEVYDNQDVKQVNLQEDDSDLKSVFGWGAVMTGYGCGLILGFSMAYVVFTRRNPEWFVNMVEGAWSQRSKRSIKILLSFYFPCQISI